VRKEEGGKAGRVGGRLERDLTSARDWTKVTAVGPSGGSEHVQAFRPLCRKSPAQNKTRLDSHKHTAQAKENEAYRRHGQIVPVY
jgi:hypothetical protein